MNRDDMMMRIVMLFCAIAATAFIITKIAEDKLF